MKIKLLSEGAKMPTRADKHAYIILTGVVSNILAAADLDANIPTSLFSGLNTRIGGTPLICFSCFFIFCYF